MHKGGKLCRYKNSHLDKGDLKKMLYRQKSSKKDNQFKTPNKPKKVMEKFDVSCFMILGRE